MNPSAFWDDLAGCFAEGTPRTWRSPLGGPVATAEEVFGWVRTASEMVLGHNESLAYRLFADGRPFAPMPDHHPRAVDRTMAEYFARLDGAAGGESALVINHLQIAGPAPWQRAMALLAPLVERTGIPAGGVLFDLFAGAYRKGAFGLHKDQFDVVTFVVEGRKRFLAWPFETFAGRDDVPPLTELEPVSLSHVDYNAYRDSAVVLEGEPGDVFYWPAEWWHVAESDGELCTTISFGLARKETTFGLLDRAARDLSEERPELVDRWVIPSRGDSSRGLAETVDMLARTLGHDAMRARLEESLLAYQTSLGFAVAPAPETVRPLPDDARLRLAAPGALAWTVRGDTLVWSALGRVFRYPAAPALVALYRRVATGEPFVVGELTASLADARVDRDALRHALARMHAHHALAG